MGGENAQPFDDLCSLLTVLMIGFDFGTCFSRFLIALVTYVCYICYGDSNHRMYALPSLRRSVEAFLTTLFKREPKNRIWRVSTVSTYDAFAFENRVPSQLFFLIFEKMDKYDEDGRIHLL